MQNAFLCNLFNIVQSCFKLFCFLLKAFGMDAPSVIQRKGLINFFIKVI